MIETIVFGGGCFWCVEAVFQLLRGVHSVTSGYTGGQTPNPTYRSVCNGDTGHVEAIKIEFDPAIIQVEDLLAVFFSSHDPTTRNRQGNDVGAQYRSAIFYASPEQKKAVEKFIGQLTAEQTFPRPIVTEIAPLSTFYPAEAYHQNYYRNNSEQAYCQFNIDPKVAKLRQKYAHLLRAA
ncbi:MAG: peptide-methionine (S)-S-oxide reductase MsrA [Candidatus Magasanikbacteria bacterium]|nr:peptide-methionine (S)-S-oxide reductase MsrA [Candidatus Magasanikbacteria bacterium]